MKFRKTVFLVPFILLLCACTVQTDFDINDFCSRYNRLKNEKILSSESFYSDKNGFYHCPVCVGESILLVSVGIKENQSVQSLCVTVEKGSFSPENTQAVFDEIRLIFSAFFYGDTKMADEALASVSFDEKFKPFEPVFRSETAEKYRYTIYSNEFAFTLTVEKNTPDWL